MDGNHPNRKKDKLNPYTLSIENDIYYITFTDGQGFFRKIEISEEEAALILSTSEAILNALRAKNARTATEKNESLTPLG